MSKTEEQIHQDKDFIIGELTKKIQQLTKERDELKANSKEKYVLNNLLKQQIQAEKKRVEELTEVLVTISIGHVFNEGIEELIDNVLSNE